jgi:hypothetical protein
MSIKLNKDAITSLITLYNDEKNGKELEIVYKRQINDDSKNKILSYLKKNYNDVNSIKYIINTHIDIISKTHRLVFIGDQNIIKEHCTNEALLDNIEINPENLDTFKQKKYNLEHKSLINKIEVFELSCNINLKSEYEEENEEIRDNFYKNYQKFRKFYRIKKLHSFEIDDKYRIDFSIIKEVKGINIMSCDFNNIIEHYELEIEYIGDAAIESIDIKNMLQYISEFERLNKDSYFIVKNEKQISKDYIKLISNILNTKKDIGPKPIGLTKKTIKNMILDVNLLEDLDKHNKEDLLYKITEKADGERYFMFINNIGNIYLINNNNNILETGLQLNLENPICKSFINSILDGEYIINNKSKYIYRFFDIYIKDTTKCFDKILKDRILYMETLNNILLNNYDTETCIKSEIHVVCELKQYQDITMLKSVLQDTYEYDIDGIIFMPIIKLKNISNISYNEILKFKEIKDNTIDVYVKNEQLKCGYNIQLSNYSKEYILADIVSLKPYIKDLHKHHIYKNFEDEIPISWNKLNNKVIEIVYDKNYKKFKLNKIRYDKTIQYNKTKKISANNFGIINDIMTNIHDPLLLEDLELLKQSTINEQYLNKNSYYKVNNSKKRNEIRDINNKIKSELIHESINILEQYYEHIKKNSELYNENPMIKANLENFKFINVLDIACGRGGDLKKFIDTCFKNKINNETSIKEFGGIQFLLGIDYDPVNIENFEMNTLNNNNARARFIQFKNNYQYNNSELPYIYENNSIYYISGDLNKYNSNKNLKENYNLITVLDNTDFPERQTCDLKLIEDINELPPKNLNINIYDTEQFHLINCQMAIHYFCNTDDSLDNFVDYISKNLKILGVFICTFMDKNYVEELINKKHITDDEGNQTVSTSILNGHLEPHYDDFWILQRMVTSPDKINVKFETLEDDFKEEPLITEQQLIDAFGKKDIVPLLKTNFKDHPRLNNNNNPNLEFCKLYKYIIFQKNMNPGLQQEFLEKFTK